MTQFTDYTGHFKMCLVYNDSKVPVGDDWQSIDKVYDKPVNGYNHGLVHEHSNTMALDIDNMEVAREIAAERGIDLDMHMMLGTQIVSGVSNRGKLIYRLPFPLPSAKITKDRKDVINFRCQGNQDLLPPSIHPDTKMPYSWIGDFTSIPALPTELFDWWSELLTPKIETPSAPVDDPGTEEIRKLLRYCDPNCSRMDWISIGFAIHDINPDYYALWQEWSATATEAGKYIGEKDCIVQWRSFKSKPNGITGKSLYYYAIKGGYGPSLEQALQIFRELDNQEDEQYIFEERFVPDLPLDLIPPDLKEYAEEIAHKVGANPIVPVAAGLTAICTAADSRSRLELQPGYVVPPVVWNIVVAPPAAKKSPASKPMFTAFKVFEKEDFKRYSEESKRYVAVQSAWASAQKNYLKATESAEWIAEGMKTEQLPHVPEEPKPPVKLRYTLTDVTSQKAVDLLEDRPQGMSLILDEGKTWLSKICDPRSNEDRSFWTVSYESDRYIFDRVGRGSIDVENLAISAYINVQPTVLSKQIKELEEDGLFQRFTPFIVPLDKCSQVSNEVPDFASKSGNWEQLLRRIKSSNIDHYTLDHAAREEFKRFELWVDEKQKDHALINSPFGFQGALGKMLGLCGRYAFIFHLGHEPENRIVPVQRVHEAIHFMKEYVYYTLRDVSMLTGNQSLDEWCFDWIITGEEEVFTLSQIKKSARRQLENMSIFEQQKRMEESLSFLAETGVIMQIEKGSNRTETYAVNPVIRERYEERRIKVVKAKYRMKKYRQKTAVKKAGVTSVKNMPVRGESLITG